MASSAPYRPGRAECRPESSCVAIDTCPPCAARAGGLGCNAKCGHSLLQTPSKLTCMFEALKVALKHWVEASYCRDPADVYQQGVNPASNYKVGRLETCSIQILLYHQAVMYYCWTLFGQVWTKAAAKCLKCKYINIGDSLINMKIHWYFYKFQLHLKCRRAVLF